MQYYSKVVKYTFTLYVKSTACPWHTRACINDTLAWVSEPANSTPRQYYSETVNSKLLVMLWASPVFKGTSMFWHKMGVKANHMLFLILNWTSRKKLPHSILETQYICFLSMHKYGYIYCIFDLSFTKGKFWLHMTLHELNSYLHQRQLHCIAVLTK